MYTELLKSGKVRYGLYYSDELGNGKRVTVTMPKDSPSNRREAEKILNAKIRKGPSENLRLRELADLYLEGNRPFVKETTHVRNRGAMNSICQIIGNNINVSKLTARSVSTALYASGKDNSTLNEYLTRFKAFMRWAYRNDYVSDVTWLQKLKPFPAPSTKEKNKEKYLEGDELNLLLDSLSVPLNKYAISWLVLSGMRVGEMLAMTVDDVDFNTRMINVDKTYSKIIGKVTEGAKTYAGNRQVYMQDELYDLAKEIDSFYRKRQEQIGFTRTLFFCDFDGKVLSYDRLNKYFRENCERIIGRKLSLHSLRHSHASLLFENGASLQAVAYRLGHQHSRVTEDIYIHITQRKKDLYNAEFEGISLLKTSHKLHTEEFENAETLVK